MDENWEALHRGYHTSLISACGLPRLIGFCTMLHDHFDRYRRLAVLHGGRHPALKANYAAIVKAAFSKDVPRAERLLAAHIRESTAQFVALLDEEGLAGLSAGHTLTLASAKANVEDVEISMCALSLRSVVDGSALGTGRYNYSLCHQCALCIICSRSGCIWRGGSVLARAGITHLVYGDFRIEAPEISVNAGKASPLTLGGHAGQIHLPFAGSIHRLDVKFLRRVREFAVTPDGSGYTVTNPQPDFLEFHRAHSIDENEDDYLFELEFTSLFPKSIQCAGVRVSIGHDNSPAWDVLDVYFANSRLAYLTKPRLSRTYQLFPEANFDRWRLECRLEQRTFPGTLWLYSFGIDYTAPIEANARLEFAGHRLIDATHAVRLTLDASMQPPGHGCGEVWIRQFGDIGKLPQQDQKQYLQMFSLATRLTPSGFDVRALHWKVYDEYQRDKISPVDVIETIPSAFYPYAEDDAPVSIRALESDVWMHRDDAGNWSSGFSFDGEVRPKQIRDRSNAGIRLYGRGIRCTELSDTEMAIAGEATPRRYPIADLIARLTMTADPPEYDRGIRALAFGNVTLVIGQRPGQWLPEDRSVEIRSHPGTLPTEQWSGWRFPIFEIRKTPLKGDSVGVDTQMPTGLDPRSEVYRPSAAPFVPVLFDWHLQAQTGDLFANFVAASDTVETLQPENSRIQFSDWTVSSYKLAGANVEEGYRKIDATLVFPSAPSNARERIMSAASAAPAVRWKEDFGAQLKADRKLRRVWDSGLTPAGPFRAQYQKFLEENTSSTSRNPRSDGIFQLPLPYGWGVKLVADPQDRAIAVFHAVKNQPDARPALEEGNAGFRRYRIWAAAGEVEGQLPASFWFPKQVSDDALKSHLSRIFPAPSAAGRDSQVVSPLDANWSGVITAKGQVVPPPGLPPTLSALIEQLKFDYVAWDGQGVTAVCDWNTPLSNNLGLTLNRFTLVIHRSQIERLSIEFEWELPFFSFQSKEKLKFFGRWEKTDSGGEIIFRSGAIGEELQGLLGELLNLRFSDIELFENAAHEHRIRLRGTIQLVTAAIASCFDGPVPPLSFRNLEFAFDNPYAAEWLMPDLRLDTELTIFPHGFRYQLSGISFTRHPQGDTTERIFTLHGGLRYATPGPAFPANPDFTVDLPFKIITTGVTIGPIDLTKVSGLEVNVFGFFKLGFQDIQNTGGIISGTVTVSDTWTETAKVTGSFLFGEPNTSRDKFWILTLAYGPDQQGYKVGPVAAKDFGIALTHNASFPGLRDKLISGDIYELKRSLTSPSRWTYSSEFPWMGALWFNELNVGLPKAFFAGGSGAVVLSDSGLFRARFPLNMMSIPFSDIDLGVDWRNRTIAAAVALKNIVYGPYRMDSGTIATLVGPNVFMVSWGYPFDDNWSRAVKLRWTPPPAIPINAVDGGVMFAIAPNSYTTGVALRVGYHDIIGSDGGMFGAYIRGEILIGGTVMMRVETGNVTALSHTGTVSLHIEAAGGLVIVGIRWEVLRVWLHAGVGFTMVIRDWRTQVHYAARFSAGYEVCPTPCTCISGSVSFTYGSSGVFASDYARDPNKSFGSAVDVLLEEERTGDAIVEMLRADFR